MALIHKAPCIEISQLQCINVGCSWSVERIFMSVAINESSNQVKTMSSSFMVSLTPKRIASFIVLQATLLGACAYFTFNHYVTPSLMSHAIHAKSANVAQQRQQVASLKQQTKAQSCNGWLQEVL